MSPVSTTMIYNPATVAWGYDSEMKKAMELLDAVKESIINAYVRKTGQSRAEAVTSDGCGNVDGCE